MPHVLGKTRPDALLALGTLARYLLRPGPPPRRGAEIHRLRGSASSRACSLRPHRVRPTRLASTTLFCVGVGIVGLRRRASLPSAPPRPRCRKRQTRRCRPRPRRRGATQAFAAALASPSRRHPRRESARSGTSGALRPRPHLELGRPIRVANHLEISSLRALVPSDRSPPYGGTKPYSLTDHRRPARGYQEDVLTNPSEPSLSASTGPSWSSMPSGCSVQGSIF